LLLDRDKHRHSAHKDWLIEEDMQLVQGAMDYTAAQGAADEPTAAETAGGTAAGGGGGGGGGSHSSTSSSDGSAPASTIPAGSTSSPTIPIPAVWSCKTKSAQLQAGQSLVAKGR
jgi:hypothetical protein